MGYADIIATEVKSLPVQKQAEILDFITFLKTRKSFFAPTHGIRKICTLCVPPNRKADGIGGLNNKIVSFKKC